LEAIRWDKVPVPAEAAISRYLYNGAPFYTVFLRSMSERLEAERRIRALIEEAESLRAVVGEAPGEMGIVGRSAGVRGVCNSIRQVEPLGGTKTRKVDVRVVAATNRSLEDEISAGRFREDLYYRLNVFPIRVPALRERGNDICLLAEAFVQRFAERMGRRFDSLTDQDRQLLKSYSWPGNVRELQNVIERALILSSGHALDLSRAMPRLDDEAPVEPMEAASADHRQARILTAAEIEELEKKNLLLALEKCGWKISGAEGVSILMGLPPSTIASRMKTLGIRRPIK
jgi:transcriptional regulator with GAF, ATPase, and Fis domain